jgi:hypothetical protein
VVSVSIEMDRREVTHVMEAGASPTKVVIRPAGPG